MLVFVTRGAGTSIDLSRDHVNSIKMSPSTSLRCFTFPTGMDNARDLIEINLKIIAFINCMPMGLSPLISISKSN